MRDPKLKPIPNGILLNSRFKYSRVKDRFTFKVIKNGKEIELEIL